MPGERTGGVPACAVVEYLQQQDAPPENWMEEFMLSDEEIAEMLDAEFIVDDLIISGHITVIAAQPGRGKTSIMMFEAAGMVEQGYRLMYVNMDCGAADVKYWHQQAKEGGFKMITPHFKGAEGITAWLKGLTEMSARDDDLSRLVIVIDTLKKIADLLQKGQVRRTFTILRALTAKGASVVCLAHCNKHRGESGGLVFEGTGDVMADCDDMLYLESIKDKYGVRTVTTEPTDKVRGIFRPRSWQIKADRSIKALDEAVDVKGYVQARSRRERDGSAIEVISRGIRSGKHQRNELEANCKSEGIGKRSFDSVIKRYCQGHTCPNTTALWRNQPQMKDNASYYTLLAEAAP